MRALFCLSASEWNTPSHRKLKLKQVKILPGPRPLLASKWSIFSCLTLSNPKTLWETICSWFMKPNFAVKAVCLIGWWGVISPDFSFSKLKYLGQILAATTETSVFLCLLLSKRGCKSNSLNSETLLLNPNKNAHQSLHRMTSPRDQTRGGGRGAWPKGEHCVQGKLNIFLAYTANLKEQHNWAPSGRILMDRTLLR